MLKRHIQFKKSILSVGVAAALMGVQSHAALEPAPAYDSPVHTFSIDDLQADFDGRTYGAAGTESDRAAICGLDVEDSPACPDDRDPNTGELIVKPFLDKEDVMLYPVDTALGFNVVDFLGAQGKTTEAPRDYREGYVGNIMGEGGLEGIKISNSATAKYKVKPPLGTWCQGLGGTSVKCSTEHYVTMEHVLSCHETVPYRFADLDGTQGVLSFPDDSASFDCANAELDDELYLFKDGELSDELLESVIPLPADGGQMYANDNTTVLDDIATSADYSITLKDDGKPLYRWGSLIKRPNDVRLYARIPLPPEWKGPDAPEYEIVNAKLIVTHWITNNPNDQLRPEDLENEAATGRKPSYELDGDNFISTKNCYEGDGDYLDSGEGASDPDPIGAGTVLKNAAFAGAPAGMNPPRIFSSDQVAGYTNAFYTTIDRDPFEWSYVDSAEAATGVFNYIGSPLPLTAEEMGDDLELVSGPRWRLKANKFGQDIPGLEIPLIECSAPPFSHDNIRYEVGAPVTTVINLLDWDAEEEGAPSPLSTSKGWVDVTQNEFVTIAKEVSGVPVSTNGLPMTDDFDLAVYVKGDRKSTAVFTAQLIINEGVDVVPPEDALYIKNFTYPSNLEVGEQGVTRVLVNNADDVAISGAKVWVLASNGSKKSKVVPELDPGEEAKLNFYWTFGAPGTVTWTTNLKLNNELLDTDTGETVVTEVP